MTGYSNQSGVGGAVRSGCCQLGKVTGTEIERREVMQSLRDGIQFHDGTPLNAASLKEQIAWIGDRANATFTIGWMTNLDPVEVMAPLKLRLKFKEP